MTLYPSLPLQAASAQGGTIPFFVPMILIGLIFYFLVIRPQNKTQRTHDEALKTAGKGDHVVTRGGLHGKVVSVEEETFSVEIGSVKGSPIKVTVEKKSVDRLTKAGAETKS
ncbi:MAG: preprotein translocase subunit YajC [bacterium]|nr:preprotein translocase subunit YajC [bacterium]MCP5040724.1 preprotein translocase subunit YajC [bacterium]